eukprot:scaffold69251_cov37-Tisochrysis_lutea.AAC.2
MACNAPANGKRVCTKKWATRISPLLPRCSSCQKSKVESKTRDTTQEADPRSTKAKKMGQVIGALAPHCNGISSERRD